MDLLFIQCLEKFDDTDRYALTLPELIERSMLRQKELVRALMDDRRKIQRMTEEREAVDRHVRQLEEEVVLVVEMVYNEMLLTCAELLGSFACVRH